MIFFRNAHTPSTKKVLSSDFRQAGFDRPLIGYLNIKSVRNKIADLQ